MFSVLVGTFLGVLYSNVIIVEAEGITAIDVKFHAPTNAHSPLPITPLTSRPPLSLPCSLLLVASSH